MDTTKSMQRWVGCRLVDREGSKVGDVSEIYVDEDSGRPEWLAVKTGWFGKRISFVPLEGVESQDDVLIADWTKDRIKDAPNFDADGRLTPSEEDELYRHYGRHGTGTSGRTTDTKGRSGRTATGTTGRSDEAMTRSEDELHVEKRERETGRARLRKYVETEHETVTVPVRKEKLKIEREPITDANRDAAMSGEDITEGEHEIVLTEEEAVVDTRTVPKERVRATKESVTEEEQVGADLRKERIEVDDREKAGRRR